MFKRQQTRFVQVVHTILPSKPKPVQEVKPYSPPLAFSNAPPADRSLHDRKFDYVYEQCGAFLIFPDDERLNDQEKKTIRAAMQRLHGLRRAGL